MFFASKRLDIHHLQLYSHLIASETESVSINRAVVEPGRCRATPRCFLEWQGPALVLHLMTVMPNIGGRTLRGREIVSLHIKYKVELCPSGKLG
jgi:hypothetical protein